jgi:hypothetical protein
MDRLTIFGLFAVTTMLVSYALEKRSPWFILAFSGNGNPGMFTVERGRIP